MALYNYSFYPLLTGGLNFNPNNTTIKAFISKHQYDNGPYISNWLQPQYWGTPTINETSNTIPFVIKTNTTPYTNGASTVFLSTGKCFFPFITGDYTNSNFSLYTFLDTGDVNTSFLLARHDFGPTAIYGSTTYYYNSNQLFYIKDGPNNQGFNYASLYRPFVSNLLSGTYTPKALSSYALALLDSSYTFDPNHTTFSNISASTVATVSLSTTVPWFSDNPYSFNPIISTCNLVATFSAITGNPITQAVVFLSSTDISVPKSLVASYFPGNIQNTPITPDGTDIYWEFPSQIIFSLF
jgi:hypothetical protein